MAGLGEVLHLRARESAEELHLVLVGDDRLLTHAARQQQRHPDLGDDVPEVAVVGVLEVEVLGVHLAVALVAPDPRAVVELLGVVQDPAPQ